MHRCLKRPPGTVRARRGAVGWAGAFAGLVLAAASGLGDDQPQWGRAWDRNLVSTERHLPDDFDVATGRNLRWTVGLGTESYSTAIVAKGHVWIGTNNEDPRDPSHRGDRGALLCLNERDGALQWQLLSPKREEDPYLDWPKTGLCSPPTVEGNRVYVVNNRGEVVCLDVKGMADGNQGPFREESVAMVPAGKPAEPVTPLDADIIWKLNLTAEAGIWTHDGAHSGILILGDHLYLNTGTGVDNTHRKIRTPNAPCLVVVDKKTGRLLARDRVGAAPETFHCTWSPPTLARIKGRNQIIQAAGNGVVYGFEPLGKTPPAGTVATLRNLWKYDFDPDAPRTEVHRFTTNRGEGPSNIYGMVVFLDGRCYVAGGGDLFWGKNQAWMKCFVPGAEGDLSRTATVWSTPLVKHTVSTPAIQGDLLFIADVGRQVHCLDRRTGAVHWSHEMKGDVWASPLIADGKVYIGSRRGDFMIFRASSAKEILANVDLKDPISATATAANETVYVATMRNLYAIGLPRVR